LKAGCSLYPAETRAHTALHVLKGAVVRVLGEQSLLTTSTWVGGSKGRLAVTAARKPGPEELARIEALANRIVAADVPVEVYVLDRAEAERLFGGYIYDAFPVPAEVRRLSIVVIRAPDGSLWNINACNKEHTATTGCVGELRLTKARFRRSKGVLEISFQLRE